VQSWRRTGSLTVPATTVEHGSFFKTTFPFRTKTWCRRNANRSVVPSSSFHSESGDSTAAYTNSAALVSVLRHVQQENSLLDRYKTALAAENDVLSALCERLLGASPSPALSSSDDMPSATPPIGSLADVAGAAACAHVLAASHHYYHQETAHTLLAVHDLHTSPEHRQFAASQKTRYVSTLLFPFPFNPHQ
jgi:hypothetical protein